MRSSLRRGTVALLAGAATSAVAFGAAAAASAASTPPWEPDTYAVGTLTFYNSSGAVITSGSTANAPFAAYAVGSASPQPSIVSARLEFANPSSTSTTPYWYDEIVGLNTANPVPGAPSSLPKGKPTVAGGSDDQTLDGFESDSQRDSNPAYDNIVQVRLQTIDALGHISTTYDDADLSINPTTHTWTQLYPAAKVTVPGAPTAVKATAGDKQAKVSWTAPSSTGGAAITGYTLQYKKSGATSYTTFKTSGTATTATVTGLTDGTAYVFHVAATNSAGTGAYSADSAAVTPKAVVTAPSAPTGVRATAGNKQAKVSWTAPSSTGGSAITRYIVQYAKSGSSTFTTFTTTGTATSATVTGLTNGTSYVFRVAAVNAVGTSAYSAVSAPVKPSLATATTLAGGVAPQQVTYGRAAVASATLRDTVTGAGIAGQRVTLYANTPGSAATRAVTTATTDAHGDLAVHVTTPHTTLYRWVYAGSSRYLGATTPVKGVYVAQRVSVAVAASGRHLRVYGTVAPSAAGRPVYLQELYSRGWRRAPSKLATIRSQKLPDGRTEVGYLLYFAPEHRGTYRLRVYIASTSTLKYGVSGTLTVKVS